MLSIENLHCRAESLEILRGVNLDVKPGKIHVLMGPNGSGKSTLAKTLMGHPTYEITQGKVSLNKKSITDLEPNEKAKTGLFMAFQYPVEVPGVSFSNFLRMAYNSLTDQKLPVFKFRKLLKEKANFLGIDDYLLDRNLNEDLSGGEKKKTEILQLAVIQPKYAILDETDSGLDLDALKVIFTGINTLRKTDKKMGILIITHYQRIFDYIKPDFVHIMKSGRIVAEGGIELIEKIETDGYKNF